MQFFINYYPSFDMLVRPISIGDPLCRSNMDQTNITPDLIAFRYLVSFVQICSFNNFIYKKEFHIDLHKLFNT